MTNQILRRLFSTALLAAILFISADVQAASIAEYFNDYGTADARLNNFGTAGGGWTGAWSPDPGTQPSGPNYIAGSSLMYSGPGYSNFGNDEGGDDGRAAVGNTTAGVPYFREFSTIPMNGTIWVSVIARTTANSGGALLWFRDDKSPIANNNFIAVRGDGAANTASARLRYGGTDISGSASPLSLDTNYLLLAQITIDTSGGSFDSIDLWVDSDLSGGAGGLGTPFRSGSGADAFGDGLRGIRVSFDAGGSLDAIRISNDPDGFAFVTTGVPEPSTWVLIGIGALFLLGRFRFLRS